jgi:hypothetical protein
LVFDWVPRIALQWEVIGSPISMIYVKVTLLKYFEKEIFIIALSGG